MKPTILIAVVIGALWASVMFRYTPVSDYAVLDRWTGKVNAVRTQQAVLRADVAAPGHLFDEFEKPPK